jgi:hypothetical protein
MVGELRCHQFDDFQLPFGEMGVHSLRPSNT